MTETVDFYRNKRQQAIERQQTERRLFSNDVRCHDCGKQMDLDGLYSDRPNLIYHNGWPVLACGDCIRKSQGGAE